VTVVKVSFSIFQKLLSQLDSPDSQLNRLRNGIETTRYGTEGEDDAWTNWGANWTNQLGKVLKAER
jgi:hypothetical protein